MIYISYSFSREVCSPSRCKGERRKNHERLVSVIEPSTFSLYDENTSVGVVEPLIFAVYDDAQVYAEHQALYLET